MVIQAGIPFDIAGNIQKLISGFTGGQVDWSTTPTGSNVTVPLTPTMTSQASQTTGTTESPWSSVEAATAAFQKSALFGASFFAPTLAGAPLALGMGANLGLQQVGQGIGTGAQLAISGIGTGLQEGFNKLLPLIVIGGALYIAIKVIPKVV